MYWPNGVPRVYAVNGPGIPPAFSDEDRAVGYENAGSPEQNKPADPTDNGPELKPESWANEPIRGLCVSRSGHLFATMTDSSIAVWQTKVYLFLFCAFDIAEWLTGDTPIAYSRRCCGCSIRDVNENVRAQRGPFDASRLDDPRRADPQWIYSHLYDNLRSEQSSLPTAF